MSSFTGLFPVPPPPPPKTKKKKKVLIRAPSLDSGISSCSNTSKNPPAARPKPRKSALKKVSFSFLNSFHISKAFVFYSTQTLIAHIEKMHTWYKSSLKISNDIILQPLGCSKKRVFDTRKSFEVSLEVPLVVGGDLRSKIWETNECENSLNYKFIICRIPYRPRPSTPRVASRSRKRGNRWMRRRLKTCLRNTWQRKKIKFLKASQNTQKEINNDILNFSYKK